MSAKTKKLLTTIAAVFGVVVLVAAVIRGSKVAQAANTSIVTASTDEIKKVVALA